MSHYTIKYEQKGRAARETEAIKNCKDWLGDRFEFVLSCIKEQIPESGVSRGWAKSARFALSFAGIQGLPATAMMRMALK
jgi:hypothetical protein